MSGGKKMSNKTFLFWGFCTKFVNTDRIVLCSEWVKLGKKTDIL